MVTIARYTVKSGCEERNAELVRAVYRALAELRPTGFSYATYRLEDGRTFLHIATREADRDNPLPTLEAFREFQTGIRERCESGPHVGEAEVIGRYAGGRAGARPDDESGRRA